jgi:hypothetical protein
LLGDLPVIFRIPSFNLLIIPSFVPPLSLSMLPSCARGSLLGEALLANIPSLNERKGRLGELDPFDTTFYCRVSDMVSPGFGVVGILSYRLLCIYIVAVGRVLGEAWVREDLDILHHEAFEPLLLCFVLWWPGAQGSKNMTSGSTDIKLWTALGCGGWFDNFLCSGAQCLDRLRAVGVERLRTSGRGDNGLVTAHGWRRGSEFLQ